MQKLLLGDVPFYLKFLGQSDHVGAKSPIFDLFSFVVPQPYDLAKKVQLTLIEIRYALSNEPKMVIVRCL